MQHKGMLSGPRTARSVGINNAYRPGPACIIPRRHRVFCQAAQPKKQSSDGEDGQFNDSGDSSRTVTEPEVTILEFPPPPGAPGAATNLLKTSGLHHTPQSGGVQNATSRCELPSPAVAVRNLVEQAQFAHLCTIMSGMHHRRAGYPFGTVVDFAADGAGYPIFSLSPLAIQTRNLLEDPRCSLVMQMPGWAGLANARVTIFGDVYKLPKNMQSAASDIFHQKMSTASDADERFVSGNAEFFRMNRILDIYFVGGFGTVQWVDVDEYTSAQPDQIVVQNPNLTLQVLNQSYSEPLRKVLSRAHGPADDAAFISIDKLGADVRVRRGGDYSVERVSFHNQVESLDDVKLAMQRLLKEMSKN